MRRCSLYTGLGVVLGALSAPSVVAFGRNNGVPYFGTDLVQIPSLGSPIGLSPPDSAGAGKEGERERQYSSVPCLSFTSFFVPIHKQHTVSDKFIVATANTRISIYDIKGQLLVPATEIASSPTGACVLFLCAVWNGWNEKPFIETIYK